MKTFKCSLLTLLLLTSLVPVQAAAESYTEAAALINEWRQQKQAASLEKKVRFAKTIVAGLAIAGTIDGLMRILPTNLVVKLGKWDAHPANDLVQNFVREKLAEIGVTETLDVYESSSMDKYNGFAMPNAHLICLPAYLCKLLKSIQLCSELITALKKGDVCVDQFPLEITIYDKTFKARDLDELIQLKKELDNELNKMIFIIHHEGTHVKNKDSILYPVMTEKIIYAGLGLPDKVPPLLSFSYCRFFERRADAGVNFNPEVLQAGIEMWREYLDHQEAYWRTDEEEGIFVKAVKWTGKNLQRLGYSLFTHPITSERIENIQKRLDEHKAEQAAGAFAIN